MIGKELQMELQYYPIISDKVFLLSNIIPSSEKQEQESLVNTSLLIYNLNLRRKNKKLNKFNNELHEQIQSHLNNFISNHRGGKADIHTVETISRNMAEYEVDAIAASQTLDIENKEALQQIDKEASLNKSNDPDK